MNTRTAQHGQERMGVHNVAGFKGMAVYPRELKVKACRMYFEEGKTTLEIREIRKCLPNVRFRISVNFQTPASSLVSI